MTTQATLPTSHHHAFNYHTGHPRFHFDEAGEAAAAAAAAAATKPWHDGVDAEFIGHAQNKGWKLDDPKEAFAAATKQVRELERHLGVPADRLLRLPATDSKPEEMRAFYERLGAPKEAKDYDLSAVTDPAIADALRNAMHARGLTKEAAADVAKAVAASIEAKKASEDTLTAAKLTEEKTKLRANWADKFDFNHLQAMEGARRAGISPEGVKAMENQIGYAATMDHFRKIGASTSEALFHQGGGGGGGGPTTREGAVARLAELEGDKAWGKRLTAGDAVAKAEWVALTSLIGNEAAA